MCLVGWFVLIHSLLLSNGMVTSSEAFCQTIDGIDKEEALRRRGTTSSCCTAPMGAMRSRLEPVDERESVAGGLRDGDHPPLHPNGIAVAVAALATAIAGLVLREGVEAG